jgi:hypothetical protein
MLRRERERVKTHGGDVRVQSCERKGRGNVDSPAILLQK